MSKLETDTPGRPVHDEDNLLTARISRRGKRRGIRLLILASSQAKQLNGRAEDLA
jgi:hypothetical protein